MEEKKIEEEVDQQLNIGINTVEVSAKWECIESKSDLDDVSSNGSISNNASPMQSPINGGSYFVEEFKGKAKVETKKLTEKEAK